jgi:hypothetical protein
MLNSSLSRLMLFYLLLIQIISFELCGPVVIIALSPFSEVRCSLDARKEQARLSNLRFLINLDSKFERICLIKK